MKITVEIALEELIMLSQAELDAKVTAINSDIEVTKNFVINVIVPGQGIPDSVGTALDSIATNVTSFKDAIVPPTQ